MEHGSRSAAVGAVSLGGEQDAQPVVAQISESVGEPADYFDDQVGGFGTAVGRADRGRVGGISSGGASVEAVGGSGQPSRSRPRAPGWAGPWKWKADFGVSNGTARPAFANVSGLPVGLDE